MKRLFLFIIAILTLAGCKTDEKAYPTIQDKLMAMESYSTKCKLTYISNKGERVYDADIKATNDGRYIIKTSSPEEYKNNIVMYDGKLIWHYNPNLENNKISITPPDSGARREIILFNFIENYVKSNDTDVETASLEQSRCTVLEAKLPQESKLFALEKLWIDNESQNPVKLVIYDKNNKERIVAEMSEFVYNVKLEDSDFQIHKQGD